MMSLRSLSLVLFIALACASPLTQRNSAFAWGKEKVRGANIGGWLVLEPWITPSIFEKITSEGYGHIVVDEWTLGQNLTKQAPGILKQHWDTWVQLADFQKLADHGFNAVRIPIGYWAYKKFDDPFVQGAAPYMDTAIGWARKTGLKVIIDLHGAPLSQNGYDNSGHNGTVGWGQNNSIADTLSVVQLIANKYAKKEYSDVVMGIELLNEPLVEFIKPGFGAVMQFYNDGFGNVRQVGQTPIVMHDGFLNGSVWDGTLTVPGAQNIIVDHHEYQVFTDELLAQSSEQHVQKVCSNSATYASNVDHWVVVGEWCAAMTDCATYLNGYGVGSRWEGTRPGSKAVPGRKCGSINDLSQWTQTQRVDTQRYIEAQLDVYEQQTQGYFFWNFKTERSPEWDLFRLIDAGLFPNLKGRKAKAVCSG